MDACMSESNAEKTESGEGGSNGGRTKKDAVQEGAHQACVGWGRVKKDEERSIGV
jgi:hypothetical protein